MASVNFKIGGVLEFIDAGSPRCIVTTITRDGTVVIATILTEDSMAYTLADDKQLEVAVQWLSKKGHPASVDGLVGWQTSDASIATVAAKNDSSKATIVPGNNLGTAQITASGDADLGEGVTEVICTMDVSIVAGQAVSGTISPTGPPVPIR